VTARGALAAATFGLAFVASYAAMRVAGWSSGEPDPAQVIASTHVPYGWRLAVAGLHGAVVALAVALGADPERWLPRVPWLVLAVVGPSALAMVAFP
jgi:hypothetical protein